MWVPYVGLRAVDLQRVRENLPVYQRISQVTNVPWEALAGVHYREHDLNPAPPPTRGGPWQFDPVPNVLTLEALLSRYTRLAWPQKSQILMRGINDFYAGGVIAACWLQKKVNGQLTLTSPDAVVKDALWGYNGRVEQRAENSSYVMNGYDKAHFPMMIAGTINGHPVKAIDHRPGAFTVYQQLKTTPIVLGGASPSRGEAI